MKPLYRLLMELSSNKLISSLTGRIAKHRVSKIFISRFAKAYKINVDEAEKSLSEYPSLNAFFTRRLKKGIRPIDTQTDTLVSPVDAVITGIGKIVDGTILSVKRQEYTIAEMVDDPHDVKQFQTGSYVVLYLSPTDYHRIHAPIDGEIVKHVHKKGRVYPVNDFGLRHMKRVLSRNERLITYIRNEYSEIAMVKVGALNVASIKLSDQLKSPNVKKGDEIAYFEFGSTVVLLIKDNTVRFKEGLDEGSHVMMGEAIGIYVNLIKK